jgi:signal transduction histidine kinase/CheY-like chemotaxis protein
MMGWSGLRFTVLASTTALVLAIAVFGWRIASYGEEQGRAAAEEIVSRGARVAEGVLNRHFLQADGALATIGTLLQALPAAEDGTIRRNAAARLMNELSAQSFLYRNIFLVGLDGTIWASGDPAMLVGPLPVPIGALLPATPGAATIAGPVRNRQTGEYSVFIARPAEIPGRFDLLAVAELPVALLAAVLAPLEMPAALRLRVETPAGMVVAAAPGQLHLVGSTLRSPIPAHGTGGAAERVPERIQETGYVYAATVRLHYADLMAIADLPEYIAMAKVDAETRRILWVSAGLALLVATLGLLLAIILRARETAERERAASRATLEAAIETLPDGFVMWDADDRLVVCNSAYRRFYSVSSGLIRVGASFEDIIRRGAEAGQYPQAGPDLDGFVAGMVTWHRSNGEPFERELPDGRWIKVAERTIPGGGIVGIRTDITAFKRTMEELARLRDAADAAKAAKSRLVAHVSHEMRTPLAGLLRLSEQAQEDRHLSEEQRRRTAQMAAAARHILAIANEMLDLAALEAGSLSLSEEAAPLGPLIEDALAMIRPIAEVKRMQLLLEAEALPKMIRTDPVRLRQILLNLLSNAVKFAPAGTDVTLALTHSRGILRVEVLDAGPGVPEADRARLFRDFVRLAPGEAEGTGLGLSISAKLVRFMGGEIGCDDNPAGQGARFWLELPLREATPTAPSPAPASFSRLRILAVDDAPANLSVLRALLATSGCLLEAVTEAKAALEILEQAAKSGEPFDLVLMDVMMPVMDGLEATRRIRAMPGALGRVPVVAVTAGAFPEDIAACKAAGMTGHLGKPVSQKALLAALAEAVQPPVASADGTHSALAALRPAFLDEIERHLPALEDNGAPHDIRAAAAHAIVAAAGGLGLDDLAEEARLTMRALRQAASHGPERAQTLARKLHARIPSLAPARTETESVDVE